MTRVDDFSKSIIYSLLVHLLILIIYSLKLSFFPEESLLYESAIRVDLVALPDKLSQMQTPPLESPQEPDKAPMSPTEPVIKDKAEIPTTNEPSVNLEKNKDTKKNSIESALDKLRKDVAIEKVKGLLKDDKSKETGLLIPKYKGNILSPGTELTGVNKMDHQDYHALLDRHVKQYWTLPEWVAKTKLKAQVRIYLNEFGVLVNVQIIRPSGQVSYDESVLESVRQASPFPAPPPKFQDVVRVDGILLGFPE
jgi:colicin import membrane protein